MPDSIARSAFPDILKRYMERDNLTQADISKHLKVSKQTVSDWVSGKKFPRVDRMQQLADLFGVLMSEMYTPSSKTYQMDLQFFGDSSFSPDEQRLVDLYRNAEPSAREYAVEMLENHQKKDTSGKAI